MSDFLEYDDALVIRELGFNETCFKMSKHRKNCENKIDGSCPLHNIQCVYPDCEIDESIKSIPLPTYSQAFRWFRKKYKLSGEPQSYQFYFRYNIIYDTLGNNTCKAFENDYKSFEEAEQACLKKLIEIVKQESNG